jgi:uncharacterized protein (DUF2267 family)
MFRCVVAQVDTLEQSSEAAVAWLDRLAAELAESRAGAYRVMSAVLHALRDKLSVAQGAELAAELPIVVKGMFYDDWDPTLVPSREHRSAAFIDRVRSAGGLRDDTHAVLAIERVGRLLRSEIGAAALDRVASSLPDDVRLTLED